MLDFKRTAFQSVQINDSVNNFLELRFSVSGCLRLVRLFMKYQF